MTITKEQAIESLKQVIDPEIGIDIVTLGLIYDVKINADNHVEVLMTLTSPMCPYAPQLIGETKEAIEKLGAKDPNVEITFDPPWEPSDEVKMILGLA